jgi:hypothetical protein
MNFHCIEVLESHQREICFPEGNQDALSSSAQRRAVTEIGEFWFGTQGTEYIKKCTVIVSVLTHLLLFFLII